MSTTPTVFIGRFQPLHNGHLAVILNALNKSDRVVVIIGSGQPQDRSLKNPWTASERCEMIYDAVETAVGASVFGKLNVHPVYDQPGRDEAWLSAVETIARDQLETYRECGECFGPVYNSYDGPLRLTGFKKDASSFYLDLFPTWEFLPVEQTHVLSATDVRKAYFSGEPASVWAKDLPRSVAMYLEKWRIHEPEAFERLAKLQEEPA